MGTPSSWMGRSARAPTCNMGGKHGYDGSEWGQRWHGIGGHGVACSGVAWLGMGWSWRGVRWQGRIGGMMAWRVVAGAYW